MTIKPLANAPPSQRSAPPSSRTCGEIRSTLAIVVTVPRNRGTFPALSRARYLHSAKNVRGQTNGRRAAWVGAAVGKTKRGSDANVRRGQSYYSVNPYARAAGFIGRATNFACRAEWTRDKDGELRRRQQRGAGIEQGTEPARGGERGPLRAVRFNGSRG